MMFWIIWALLVIPAYILIRITLRLYEKEWTQRIRLLMIILSLLLPIPLLLTSIIMMLLMRLAIILDNLDGPAKW